MPAVILASCGASDETTQAECDEWSNQASSGRRAAQDQAGRACSEDDDCVLVDYQLDCFADCGYSSPVARSGVTELEQTVQSLDERFCGAFESHSCPGPIIPPCEPPLGTPAARCQGGQCALEWVGP
jgi:hypothetical protein